MSITEFPTSVIEHIGYYVYTLTDPSTSKVFYIGKGTGNRVFAHVNEAIENANESDKLNKLREIRTLGQSVKYEIVRHGMTENEAIEVEAAFIDYFGLHELTNKVSGYKMDSRGRMSVAEIIAAYEARPIIITEPALLIIINREWKRNTTPERLYEITRGNWDVGVRRNKAKFAFSVYKGIVREVYRIKSWFPAQARRKDQKRQSRWRFEGEVAHELQHYVGGSVKAYLKRGARKGFRYVNC